MIKKTSTVTFLLMAAIVTMAGASYVSAQTPANNPGLSIVQRISQRFGLNQSDVQSVFDQHHQEVQTEHRARMEERLNQLVAEGKLNETQKQAILTKLQEMVSQKQSNGENFRTMTPEQRQAEMQKKHDEMKSWADSIGIDPSILGGFGMVHPFGHRRFGMKMGAGTQ